MRRLNPAFTQSLDARSNRAVLLPRKIFVLEVTSGGVPIRVADHAYVEHHLTLIETQKPVDNGA